MGDAIKTVLARNARIARNERAASRQAEVRRIIYARSRAW